MKTLGYAALIVGAGWIYVMVLNRSIDGDIESLDTYVRDRMKKYRR